MTGPRGESERSERRRSWGRGPVVFGVGANKNPLREGGEGDEVNGQYDDQDADYKE